ncbi:MAG: aldehyde dehydrogenase family protein [Candidatus Kapabacteria bacterium]|nr:aldehyde dehydrogenase family protein [Ignavibacteriota bacterium]MCW5884691.1 aldehyde dehydrogenase family protein [Candidatus Kapabacteria bacterium]
MLKFSLQISGAKATANYRDILSPYNFEKVGEVEIPDANAVAIALNNAEYSFREIMKNMPAWRRAEILYKVSEQISNEKQLLAEIIAVEGGKPLKDALIEVTRAVNTVKMSGDYALNLNGDQISMDRAAGSENHIAFTIKQGMGVVLAISAFNHPVNLICHQVATSFAAGNSVLVKPASQTPLSCLKICSYFENAGLDSRVINVIPISGKDTENIIGDTRIKFVSFIGSAEVGWNIPKLVAPGTGYGLEHGGTAVAVVDDSADLEFASTSIVKGGFYHAGQVCVSTQNIFVKNDIFDKFLELIKYKTLNLVTGNPLDIKTDVGPIINSWEHNRILSQIEEATQMGAVIVAGGKAISETCIEPTIMINTNYDMKLMNNEVFGPVININTYNKLDDVISVCNKTPFSFQNAIYTKNIDAALKFAKKIDSKAVIINDSTAFRVDWMPFGGAKESGFRVGGIKYSIDDVTEEKLIVIRMHDYDA